MGHANLSRCRHAVLCVCVSVCTGTFPSQDTTHGVGPTAIQPGLILTPSVKRLFPSTTASTGPRQVRSSAGRYPIQQHNARFPKHDYKLPRSVLAVGVPPPFSGLQGNRRFPSSMVFPIPSRNKRPRRAPGLFSPHTRRVDGSLRKYHVFLSFCTSGPGPCPLTAGLSQLCFLPTQRIS